MSVSHLFAFKSMTLCATAESVLRFVCKPVSHSPSELVRTATEHSMVSNAIYASRDICTDSLRLIVLRGRQMNFNQLPRDSWFCQLSEKDIYHTDMLYCGIRDEMSSVHFCVQRGHLTRCATEKKTG